MDFVADQGLFINIKKIQDGDHKVLEQLIEHHKPFILKTAVQFCKRMLVWGHDDELSIGLIAFNTALNTYDLNKKTPFLSYCRVVIENKLKDYARSQSKYHSLVQLDDNCTDGYFEDKAAHEDYLQRRLEDERRQELEQLENILSDYSIRFEDLAEVSPKHRDSRQTLFNVAQTLSQTEEFWHILTNKKQLPLNELEKACGVKRKTLERGRKFIIATAVILYNLDQFIHLGSYINVC